MTDQTEAWDRIIERLQNWHKDPGYFDGEELAGPSPPLVDSAFIVARLLQKLGHEAPDRVVPDANGGIVFERSKVWKIHLWSDGDVTVWRAGK